MPPAAELRTKVAHSAAVGTTVQFSQAPPGATENTLIERPLVAANILEDDDNDENDFPSPAR